MKRTKPIGKVRERAVRPIGFYRVQWDESVHEGGHALMTFCLGESVVHVNLPDSSGQPYTRSGRHRLSPGGEALLGVAGVAAERSRGKRSAKFPATDRGAIAGVGVAERRGLEDLAEDFFRLPAVAPLLENAARFLYARWGTGEIPGEDLLATIGEFPEVVCAAADRLLEKAVAP